MIKEGTTYRDLGADYFDRRNQTAVVRRLVERLEGLGYTVNVSKAA